ncbi:MAG: hypothetical protein AMJ62_08865 [Myxococcales bacterium SG8_38]|nr:MAG: hypothetical protein AMJ62_08865 [Myxococcales bacterium SG8_38]
MVKRALVLALVAACSLVVLQGCKSDTAKDAKFEPVALLEAGQEPRELLRYKLTDGTITTSTMEVTTSSMATTTSAGAEIARRPGLRVVVTSGPAVNLPNGNTRYDVQIVNAEAIMPAGVDPQVKNDLDRSAALLKKVRGWIEVDDRGIVQAADLSQATKDANLPARMLISIVNARTSFSRVMLPAEPVGIGAKWETTKDLMMFGFKIKQVDRYTLTDKIGDELRLDVDIVQTAPKQTLTLEEDGVEYALESLSMSAQGTVVLNLNALEGSAEAMGQSAEVMTVKTVEGTEKIEVNTAMQLKTTVRHEASKKKAAAVEEEAKKAATGQE